MFWVCNNVISNHFRLEKMASIISKQNDLETPSEHFMRSGQDLALSCFIDSGVLKQRSLSRTQI